MSYKLHQGDCLDVLRTMPDASVDAVVTDPPYGLAFMGKKWDYDVPSVEIWEECLRVLKPGGHLLAFAGTRTQHRMAVRIEDAGFEIRDMIAWVYGSGFPKSHNVSKAIDKMNGYIRGQRGALISENGSTGGPNYERTPLGPPVSEDAKNWDGWSTALKPALEPITVARKPFRGTVAANVLEYGTGAINIDGCRVGTENMSSQWDRSWNDNSGEFGAMYSQSSRERGRSVPDGRWPANFVHDGSDEVLALFPETAGAIGMTKHASGSNTVYGKFERSQMSTGNCGARDSGSAARYFYSAKASKKDRGEGNNHPTVKPTDLMRYLCRLVTPPGGVILDPFMGSGSTGKAAMLEGFRFIGIEREAEYIAIARARIEEAAQ